jgi:hypothetical protein
MAGTMISFLLLSLLILASIVCIFGPLAALSIMFWHWHKELKESARLRVARSTQLK